MMEALVYSLSAISDVPTNAADLLHPQPAHVQRLYKSILVKNFGIPEQAMQQADLGWISTEMQRDPDLYSRSEGPLLLCRFVQSILNDYVAIGDDVPQFGIGCLVDPKPRETRSYLHQLATIAQLKKMAKPHYDEELRSFDHQLAMIKAQEDRALELEARLERLTTERAARLRLDENLCRQKDERASALEALTRAASDMEQKMEATAELLAKNSNTVVAKRAEEAAARRKCAELDYDLADDPEALRERVEELRAHKIDQQRLQDTETREVCELEQRDEQCRHAANTMNSLEGEMGVATKTVALLIEALGEMHEKEAVLEELHELLASKKEGVEKKRAERGAFRARHEEERIEQRERLDEISSRIADTRAECDRLRSLEGSVKKSVLEQRAKLARLRNEKNAEISTLMDYVATRTGLLQKLEDKMVEKRAVLQKLEAAYEEGKRCLSDAMTTSDLDVSVTVTMQLTD
ncbi:hypothetical protein PRIPAC_74332 [Pristionchus pacificus]|uniref:Uncharacterized protein n=1 Tax=Pristionchus pacificus TaxID=54126 RepID=A0A2A6C110_PRIPA|nr:hypothetical protein PRIPAC_74332 [Pristionchus pacificus]|eukprot:PDM71796.1 hypothetical protein PRIPAC_38203 [Pristionchus pacificus]